MGYLVNAVSFRVGYSRSWLDDWFCRSFLYSYVFQNVGGVRSLVLYVLSFFSFESIGVFVDRVFISVRGGRLVVNLYLFDRFVLDFISQLVYPFYFSIVDLVFSKLLYYFVYVWKLVGVSFDLLFDLLFLRLEHEFALKFLYLILYFFDLRVNFFYVFLQIFNYYFNLSNFFFLIFFDLSKYFGRCWSWLYFLVVLGLHFVRDDNFFLDLFSSQLNFEVLVNGNSSWFVDQLNFGGFDLFDLVFLDFLNFFFRGLLFFFLQRSLLDFIGVVLYSYLGWYCLYDVEINFFFLDFFQLSASFFAWYISRLLGGGSTWWEVVGPLEQELNEMVHLGLIFGFKVQFSGSFTRRQSSVCLWITLAKLSLSMQDAFIDYSFCPLVLNNGVGSIKVWIFRDFNLESFFFRYVC